jgi:hypothetical protein
MLPDIIVLDTREIVKEFKRQMPAYCAIDVLTLETLHAIVNCIQYKHMADYELREYAAQLEFDVDGSDDVFTTDADVEQYMDKCLKEAECVLELGMRIKKKIDELKIYDGDGCLNYSVYEEHYDDGKPVLDTYLKIDTLKEIA